MLVLLIWTAENAGAALAANSSRSDGLFAAKAAPTKLKTSVCSVFSVAKLCTLQSITILIT